MCSGRGALSIQPTNTETTLEYGVQIERVEGPEGSAERTVEI